MSRTKHLTIRGIDAELERRLRGVARARDLSLNKAALALLRRGAGITAPGERANVVGDALDAFIGTWSTKEERAFLRAIRIFERVDEDLWR
jgi:hypothetical protein